MRKVLLLMLMLCNLTVMAQTFDEMKAAMNEHSLPLVNISVDWAAVNSSSYVGAQMEIADFWRRTDGQSSTTLLCKVKFRGATTLRYEKKSLAVKLTDSNGDNLDANILGLHTDNNWILDAMSIDRIRMRNRVCFDIWNEISRTPYPTKYDNRNGTVGEFVEVFVNGTYHGLFCMTDKICRKLLGLKKIKTDSDGNTTPRGLLYKCNAWASGCFLNNYEDEDTDKDTWNAWELQYPDDFPSAQTWQPLKDLIDFCRDETDLSTFSSRYTDYFYMDNLVDYFVFTNALHVRDNLYKNTFLSTVDITSGHRFLITVWDMDTSMGGEYNGDYNTDPLSIDRYSWIPPFNRLYNHDVDGFNQRVLNRWHELSSSVLSYDHFEACLKNYAQRFKESGAWARERARWNGNPVELKEDIDDELAYVLNFYQDNSQRMNRQTYEVAMGIDGVGRDKQEENGTLYNLNGQRLSTLPAAKNIYIMNGRKYIAK